MKTKKIKVQSNTSVSVNTGTHFDPVLHKYTLDGEVCISGTEWLGQYAKEFDKNMVAGAQAKHSGQSQITILRDWNVEGEGAIAFGNYIHALAEMYHLNKKKLTDKYGGMGHYVTIVVNMMNNITTKFQIIAVERRGISRNYKIGFTLDIVLRKIPTAEDPTTYYVIADHKTVKILTTEEHREAKTKYNVDGSILSKGPAPALLDPPFRELDMRNVAIDKVTIQTGLYAILLATDDTWPYWDMDTLEDVRRWVIHIPENSDRYPGKGYDIIELDNIDSYILQELNK